MNDPSLERALDVALDRLLAPSTDSAEGPSTAPTVDDPALAPLVEAARALQGWETPALRPSDRAALWTAIRSRAPTSAPPAPVPPAGPARSLAPWIGGCVLAFGALAALLASRGRAGGDADVRRADPGSAAPARATVVGRRMPHAPRLAPAVPPETASRSSAASASLPASMSLPASASSPTSASHPASMSAWTSLAATQPHAPIAADRARPTAIALAPTAPPPVAPSVGGNTIRPTDVAPHRDRPAGTARPTVTPGPVLPQQPPSAIASPMSSPPAAEPPAAAPATGIAGIVRDTAGRPIARAVVRAEPEDDVARFVVAVADEGGAYHLTLPAGRWRLSAAADGYAPRWWPAGATAGEALGVDVVDGAVTDGIDFALPPGDSAR